MNRIVTSAFVITMALTVSACGSRQGVPGTANSQPEPFLLSAEDRPERITVKKGDTIYGLAYQYGITSRSLIAANKLQPPYTLIPGTELDLPTPQQHIVIEGEDAAGIAAFYGVDLMVLARENRLGDNYAVKAGDRLVIPTRDTVANDTSAITTPGSIVATSSLAPLDMGQGSPNPMESSQVDLGSELAQEKLEGLDIHAELQREMNGGQTSQAHKESEDESGSGVPMPPVKAMAAATTAVGVGAAKVASSSASSAPSPITKPTTPSAAPAPATTPAQAPAAASTTYIWPAKGNVISKFGDIVDGAKNDGINIAVAEGAPVQAAAGGEVLHAGPLQGFGKLVLVKHSNGFMTAYGHNSELLVGKGELVQKGQQIAKAGSTGDVNSPQLHFELRKGTEPIDPMPHFGS